MPQVSRPSQPTRDFSDLGFGTTRHASMNQSTWAGNRIRGDGRQSSDLVPDGDTAAPTPHMARPVQTAEETSRVVKQ